MTPVLVLCILAVSVAVLVGRILRHRRERFLAGRLGMDLGEPAKEIRRRAEEKIEASAGVLSHAAGLSSFGRLYGGLLQRAGVQSPKAGSLYLAAKIVGVIAVTSSEAVLFGRAFWAGGAAPWVLLSSALAAWLLPDLFLWLHVRERRNRLRKGLPVWLDLHTTLVEGGLGFDAALARIVTETQGTKDPLFRELARMHKELLVGSDQVGGLRRMADRMRVEEFDQVVAALVQADRIGAGIVNALRAQADMVRNKVWEDARARAEKLPTKLLFPIFVGILPMFVVLIMMPLAMHIVRTIKGFR